MHVLSAYCNGLLSHHLPQRLHVDAAAYERESPVPKEPAGVATETCNGPLC